MTFADLFDWFDHVYIVNLAQRGDRRVETIAEFSRVGLTIPNAQIDFFEASRPSAKGTFPSIGSLGNIISQTRVLADALDRGLTRVLICEDDLYFNDLPADQITAILQELQTTNWSIALLGYLEPETPPTGPAGLISWGGDTLGVQFWAIQGTDIIRGFHDYLQAVRARPSGHPDGGSMFFDAAFNMVRSQLPDVEFRLANPNMAGQRSSRTDIHALRFFDRIEPFRSIVSLARKLRNHNRRT